MHVNICNMHVGICDIHVYICNMHVGILNMHVVMLNMNNSMYADLPLTLLGAPVSIGALLEPGSRSPGAEPQDRD